MRVMPVVLASAIRSSCSSSPNDQAWNGQPRGMNGGSAFGKFRHVTETGVMKMYFSLNCSPCPTTRLVDAEEAENDADPFSG